MVDDEVGGGCLSKHLKDFGDVAVDQKPLLAGSGS